MSKLGVVILTVAFVALIVILSDKQLINVIGNLAGIDK